MRMPLTPELPFSGNGVIDVEEFVTLMCQRRATTDNDENIREAFRVKLTLYIP